MQTKSTNKTAKDAVQTICDVIFKVVFHELKKLDDKWAAQIKRLEKENIKSVIPNKRILSVPFSIETNKWTQIDEEAYTAEVLNKYITKTMTLVGCDLSDSTSANCFGPIGWETAVGKVTLSVSAPPEDTVHGNLCFCEMAL